MTEIAKDKFQIGDRVVQSDAWMSRERHHREPAKGVVVGFSNKPHGVTVRRDGVKTPGMWHMDFWDIDLSWRGPQEGR